MDVPSLNTHSRVTWHAVPKALIGSAIAVILTGAAQAQQAPTASSDQNKPEMQEVVVTGTLLKRVDAETAEAVTTVKMDALKARFGDHTDALFRKHNMKSVGYWIPQDEPRHRALSPFVRQTQIRHRARPLLLARR